MEAEALCGSTGGAYLLFSARNGRTVGHQSYGGQSLFHNQFLIICRVLHPASNIITTQIFHGWLSRISGLRLAPHYVRQEDVPTSRGAEPANRDFIGDG